MAKTTIKNIYGKRLRRCRKKHTRKNKNKGSWDSYGFCSEMDGGVHQICFQVNDATKDFSKKTFQPDWSSDRLHHNHCMCLGAWALYKARQNKNDIKKTNNELVCDAIPETALHPRYIATWNHWNHHEEEDQILDGIKALYNQCYKKGTPREKRYLARLYKKLIKLL